VAATVKGRDLCICPSSSPSGLHHSPEVLFSFGQKLSESKNDLTSFIHSEDGLIMEIGMVREVHKHFCLNISSRLLLF